MPSEGDEGTKTVRVAASAARKLQTISTLKGEMGEKFKPVEFLNGLVEGPIDELYEEMLKKFAEFQASRKRKRH